MRRYLLKALVVISLLFSANVPVYADRISDFEVSQQASNKSSEFSALQPLSIKTASGDEIRFDIELADTPETQQLGLMHRKSLPEKQGMLFIFEQEYFGAMWMKDTYIPLDMIFIDFQGKIVKIHHLAKPLSLTPIKAETLIKSVLEINGGLSRSLGLSVGDQVIHPAFN